MPSPEEAHDAPQDHTPTEDTVRRNYSRAEYVTDEEALAAFAAFKTEYARLKGQGVADEFIIRMLQPRGVTETTPGTRTMREDGLAIMAEAHEIEQDEKND